MNIGDERLHVYEDGSIDRPGIVTPEGTKLVKRTAKALVYKVPGHKYWSGRAQQSYAPAEFTVGQIVSEDGNTVIITPLISFDVKS